MGPLKLQHEPLVEVAKNTSIMDLPAKARCVYILATESVDCATDSENVTFDAI